MFYIFDWYAFTLCNRKYPIRWIIGQQCVIPKGIEFYAVSRARLDQQHQQRDLQALRML